MKTNSQLSTAFIFTLLMLVFTVVFLAPEATSASSFAPISPWTEAPNGLSRAVALHEVVVKGNYLYSSGGRNATEFPKNVYIADIDSNGVPGVWREGTALPNSLYLHAMVATETRLYVIGGWDNKASRSRNEVLMASFSNNGQSIGDWVPAGQYPNTVHLHEAVIVGNYLYVLGGFLDSNTPTNKVMYAEITANGTLGTWNETSGFLGVSALYRMAAVASDDTIYVTGGFNGATALNTVYYAKPGADGKIPEWKTTEPLLSARYYHQALIIDNKLTVLGGNDGQAIKDDVIVALIQNDDTLGGWTTEGQKLPKRLQQFGAATTKQGNRFFNFVVGGQSQSGYEDKVYASTVLLPEPTPLPIPTPTPGLKVFLSHKPERKAESGDVITYTITYSTVNYRRAGDGDFTNVIITNTIPVVDDKRLKITTILNGGQKMDEAIVWQIGSIITGLNKTVSYAVMLPSTLSPSPTPLATPFVQNRGATLTWTYSGTTSITTTGAIFNNGKELFMPFVPKEASPSRTVE